MAAHGWAVPGHCSDDAPHWRRVSPGRYSALWQAARLARESGHAADAAAHGFLHARGVEIPALNLLYANQALGLDSLWLHYLNKYLAYFPGSTGALRLTLRPGSGDRLHRLSANPAAPCAVPEASQPLVSVLMPAYNAHGTLEMAARSILAQTWRRLELIILDDASTDDTPSVAERLAEADPRVRPVRLPSNAGPYVAKNMGVYHHSLGEYLTVHDADDWASPTRLEEQMAPLLQARNSGGPVRVSLGNSLRMERQGRFTRFQPTNWVTEDGAMRTCFPSPLFERRYFVERLGAWDSVKVGADTEILQRIRRFDRLALAELDRLVMLQLDDERNLTRQPETYNDERGESPGRVAYREAWGQWHAGLVDLPRVDPGAVGLRLPGRGMYAVTSA